MSRYRLQRVIELGSRRSRLMRSLVEAAERPLDGEHPNEGAGAPERLEELARDFLGLDRMEMMERDHD